MFAVVVFRRQMSGGRANVRSRWLVEYAVTRKWPIPGCCSDVCLCLHQPLAMTQLLLCGEIFVCDVSLLLRVFKLWLSVVTFQIPDALVLCRCLYKGTVCSRSRPIRSCRRAVDNPRRFEYNAEQPQLRREVETLGS